MKAKMLLAALLPALGASATAQDVCEGNGLGNCYITTTPWVIGGNLELNFGSPTSVGVGVLSVAGDFTPQQHHDPLIGLTCLNFTHPVYFVLIAGLDVNGNKQYVLPLQNDPLLVNLPPFYANGLTVEVDNQSQLFFSISKTVRISFENQGAFNPTASAGIARAMHTATALGDGPADQRTKVFIAGGGDGHILFPDSNNTTEIYDSLSRTYTPGPNMNADRLAHRSVRLQDGRVLITGGSADGGAITTSCDIYDPDTNTITVAAPMANPRIGHGLTLLPDGRVLASGGFADWTNAAADFIGRLNTAQDTTEIYDPVNDSWSAGPVMASKRAGHTSTALQDGRVLLVSGARGGQSGSWGGAWPSMTETCEIFDPVTNTLTATAPLTLAGPFGDTPFGRCFHAASLLGDGRVAVSGGAVDAGEQVGAQADAAIMVWDGASWTYVANLQTGVAFHTQTATADGNAVMTGGMTGTFGSLASTALAGFFDGTAYTPTSQIGENAGLLGGVAAPRANHTATLLHDGTVLVLGGSHGTDVIATYADSWVHTPLQ